MWPLMPSSRTPAQAAGADVMAHQLVLRVHRHVRDAGGLGVIRHVQAVQVIRVEHRAVARDLDDDALHLGELLQRVDALVPR